jgi:PAP2 superfamily protein
MKKIQIPIAAALTILSIAAPARADDAVLEWNRIARTLVVVPAYSPVEQTRLMAIVQVAVHDAVSGIVGRYHTYQSLEAAPADASPDAAAIAAAYYALKGYFDGGTMIGGTTLDDHYTASLASHAIPAADPGIEFGRTIAMRLVALRAQDGAATAKGPYTPPPNAGAPGVWVPLGAQVPLLPGWGRVTPFVLRSGSQFRPDGPAALDSERYARDYDEIRQIGRATTLARTDEQTQIALFWRASPTAIWNDVIQQVITARGLDSSAAARALALFYLAASDASVACWDAKYFYNSWRPQPAIVNGEIDGNPATAAEPGWLPLVPTPPHPEYPSGHTSNSGAMAAILAMVFGDAPGIVIEARSSQNPGFLRYWHTFSEGVDEVIDARIYSGIHFRTADEAGARLGRQVARFVITHALRPAKGSWKD